MPVVLRLRRVGGRGPPLDLPRYETEGSAGLDLRADEPFTLAPGERRLVPTGLALVNAPGTIDSDYRGEVQVILVNLGKAPVSLARGDRVAQLVIAPVTRAIVEVVEELAATERGAGGFGSTGQ